MSGRNKHGAKWHQRAGVIFGLAMLEGDEMGRWGKGDWTDLALWKWKGREWRDGERGTDTNLFLTGETIALDLAGSGVG